MREDTIIKKITSKLTGIAPALVSTCVQIGGWNMDDNSEKIVFLPKDLKDIDLALITGIQAEICDDSRAREGAITNWNDLARLNEQDGKVTITENGILLTRYYHRFFDSKRFSSGLLNRGHITIQYEEYAH